MISQRATNSARAGNGASLPESPSGPSQPPASGASFASIMAQASGARPPGAQAPANPLVAVARPGTLGETAVPARALQSAARGALANPTPEAPTPPHGALDLAPLAGAGAAGGGQGKASAERDASEPGAAAPVNAASPALPVPVALGLDPGAHAGAPQIAGSPAEALAGNAAAAATRAQAAAPAAQAQAAGEEIEDAPGPDFAGQGQAAQGAMQGAGAPGAGSGTNAFPEQSPPGVAQGAERARSAAAAGGLASSVEALDDGPASQPNEDAIAAAGPQAGAPSASWLAVAGALQPAAPDTAPGAARLAVAAPVSSPEFGLDLGRNLIVLVQNGVQSAQLSLHPANLGPLRVEVQMQGQAASVVFTASHEATRAALHEALPQLQALFEQNGLSLANAQVGADPQSGTGYPQAQAGGSQRGASDTKDGDGAAAAAASPPPILLRRAGLVDTFA